MAEAEDAHLGTTMMTLGHSRSRMVRAEIKRIASLPQVLLNTVCDFLYVHEHVVLDLQCHGEGAAGKAMQLACGGL